MQVGQTGRYARVPKESELTCFKVDIEVMGNGTNIERKSVPFYSFLLGSGRICDVISGNERSDNYPARR